MKSKQSNRQKQSLTKYKTYDLNYQSARQCQNNQKLANLLNLSQFNMHINMNQKYHDGFSLNNINGSNNSNSNGNNNNNNNGNSSNMLNNINNKLGQCRKSFNIFKQLSHNHNHNHNHNNTHNNSHSLHHNTHNSNININTYLNDGQIDNNNNNINNNDNQNNSPNKKPNKTKRSKSTRKHILSCHQILNIAKKRDTYSMLEINKNNTNLQYGTLKNKKKNKKDNNTNNTYNNTNNNNNNICKNHSTLKIKNTISHPHSHPHHNNNNNNNQHSSSLNNSKAIITKQQNNNFAINYPLSMSHSYIVFSQKDSTLNNTTNILTKMSKKLTKSKQKQKPYSKTKSKHIHMYIQNQNKYIDLQNKLQIIKIQHAAIIIQKNWRGYLTRKLLQDYINNQQARLLNIKIKKQEFQNFQKMSPGYNKLLWQENIIQNSQISQILQTKQQQYQYSDQDQKQQQQQQQQRLQKYNQQNKSNQLFSQNNQNNKTIIQFQQQSSSFVSQNYNYNYNKHYNKYQNQNQNKDQDQNQDQLYIKQSPIINGSYQQNQIIIQSVFQYQSSQNITTRQQSYRHQQSIKQTQKYQSNQQNQQNLNNICTQNSNKNIIKKINNKLKINHQFSQVINSQKKQLKILTLDYNQIINNFQENIRKLVNQKIQKNKKMLVEQVKNSTILFDKMLEQRQLFKKITNDFNDTLTNFKQKIYNIFQLIPQGQGNYKLNEQNKVQFQSPRNMLKINRNMIKNNLNQQRNHQKQTYNSKQNSNANSNCNSNNQQSLNSAQQSGQNILFIGNYFQNKNQCYQQQSHKNNSPISQYFTIQLPTQQLSPHKNKISSGLDSLKTYFFNLHQQYLQQSEQATETSYLCKVLKKHSQIGPQNMVQRCLIQMLVQMLTNQHTFQDILYSVDMLIGQIEMIEDIRGSQTVNFVKKWADELDKWQLGPIEEVSGNMEQSADVTQRNNTSKRKKKIRQLKQLLNEN